MTKQEFWKLVGEMVAEFSYTRLDCRECPVFRMYGKNLCCTDGKCGEKLQEAYSKLEDQAKTYKIDEVLYYLQKKAGGR